ncbi:hypothetical protein B0H14DRAFT_1091107 [Mycena olivaceomarginata]|nr:hypothetical protein B0H14DRAFT_1091107 [Mycena olivaceomarginata]
MEGIDGFHRRMSSLADAFQISALLNIQGMLSNDGWAARQDGDSIHKRLTGLEQNQMQLWHTLGPNQQPQYFVQPQVGLINWPLAYGPAVLNPTQTSSVSQHYYCDPSNSYRCWCGGRPSVWWNPTSSGPVPPSHTIPVPITSNPQPPEKRKKRILINLRATSKYHGFTNGSRHSVTYNGKRYPTSEHLYQALRYIDVSLPALSALS